jgi:hypothetical protein
MYYVRFHLAKGQHFKHWQITAPDGSKTFHDPNDVQIKMFGCTLHNQPGTAARINAGEIDKTVCAGVECEHLVVKQLRCWHLPAPGERVFYNPRVTPFWRDCEGVNIDGSGWEQITTMSSGLFATGRVAEHVLSLG